MSELELWLAMLAMGTATFLIRLSMIALMGRVELPELLRRALRYVPPAVLSAIVLPALVVNEQNRVDLTPGNLRLMAGLLAAVIAWRTRNVVVTILAGMAALWALKGILE